MMRAGLLAIVLLGACGVGDEPPPNNTLGRVCSASLTVTGSFMPGAAAPANPDGTAYEGCWPIGTWTFSAAIAQNDCMQAPQMLPSYAFKGTLSTDPQTGDPIQSFSYVTDPSAHAIVKVSAAGNKMCEGGLTVFSPDGLQVWNLKPWLNPDNTINGEGDYSLYSSDQWVGQ